MGYKPAGTIASLKMDENATEERTRWNIKDNRICGVCYEHGYAYLTNFDRLDYIERLNQLLRSGEIHKTKEDLVLAIGDVASGGHINPLQSFPTYSKSLTPQFGEMFEALSMKFRIDVIATEGCNARHQFFNN